MYRLDSQGRITLPMDLITFCKINAEQQLGIYQDNKGFFFHNIDVSMEEEKLMCIVCPDVKHRINLPKVIKETLKVSPDSQILLYVQSHRLYIQKEKGKETA